MVRDVPDPTSESKAGSDVARQSLWDPGGGWPPVIVATGQQAGSPGEYTPTPLSLIAATNPSGVFEPNRSLDRHGSTLGEGSPNQCVRARDDGSG